MRTYTLSRWARVRWTAALVLIPLLSIGMMFRITDDGLVDFQNSELAQLYATPVPDSVGESEPVVLPTRYGQPGGATTLVLYDDQSARPEHAEMYAIAVANLATHFGTVQIMPTDDYGDDVMNDYDAAIFVGTDHLSELPQELLDDVRQAEVPVLWIGENADDLVEGVAPDGRAFTAQYGWDPNDPILVPSDAVQQVEYKGQLVQRNPQGTREVYTPRLVSVPGAAGAAEEDAQAGDAEARSAEVEVLVWGVCGKEDEVRMSCGGDTAARVHKMPWVVRSDNLTYIAEIPLHYIDHNEFYLVFADLYYDLLAPDTQPVQQAAVRLEDVGPEADPQDLRRVADVLHARGVPFQVAVVPILIDRTPDGEDWYGLSLLDAPDVVAALQYMQDRGGTLVQHGTTHQYGASNNPYSGRSGEDYEFFRYGCSRTEFPPYQWEGCVQDSWVRKTGAVPDDDIADHAARMDHGRQIMIDAGLGDPQIFETPHYTASVNAYLAMAQNYDARYEQVEYYAGLISSGQTDPDLAYGQIFPYSVHDIYGSRVFPENLQNITETEQNNHAIRTPQTLIDRAEANLVVRESTASFYFHPYLHTDYLEEVIDGIEDLGYTFVPVDELE